MYTSDTFILKAINLQVNDWLYGKIKRYSEERGMGVVVAIRLILSEFFRTNFPTMSQSELPAGIIDMGEEKGYLIDMNKLRDENGVVHIPPSDLTKEQTLEWVRKYHNGKNKE